MILSEKQNYKALIPAFFFVEFAMCVNKMKNKTKIPHCRNSVGTKQNKNTTLSEQRRNKTKQKYHTVGTASEQRNHRIEERGT
jgi:hypothetical protein